MIQRVWHQLRESIRQPDGLRVIDAAEHHVRHPLGLIHDGRHDVRMAMAVADGPPRREGIDDLLARVQFEPRALRGDHVQRLARRFHLAVGPPERQVLESLPLGIVRMIHELCRNDSRERSGAPA